MMFAVVVFYLCVLLVVNVGHEVSNIFFQIDASLSYKNVSQVFSVQEYKALHPELFTHPGCDDRFHFVVILTNGNPMAVAFFDLSSYSAEQMAHICKLWKDQVVQGRFLLSEANFQNKELYIVLSEEQIGQIRDGSAKYYPAFKLLSAQLAHHNIAFSCQTLS